MEESAELSLTENHEYDLAKTEASGRKFHKERQRKIIQTFILYFGFFALGLALSMIGPTLLELQRKTGTTTKVIAYVFTTRSVFGLGGALLAGFLTHRLNHWLLLSCTIGMFGALTILKPHMEVIWILLLLFALSGFSSGFFNACGNMVLLKVWGEGNGPWMQALHFIFGIGALLGPLIASQFLVSHEDQTDVTSLLNSTVTYKVLSTAPQDELDMLQGLTNTVTENLSSTEGIDINNNLTDLIVHKDITSQVCWAYMIVGLCSIISSALFLSIALFCSEIEISCKTRMKDSADSKKKILMEEEQAERKAFRMQIIIMIFFFYLLYCTLEANYGNFLTIYAVKDLDWSEKEGARVTAAYWASFTAGRGLGIILVKLLAPWILLTGDLAISGLSLIILLFFSQSHYMVLWACTLALGFGISTVFATGITWTEQYIKITGVAGAVFIVAGCGGEVFGPILIGTLFSVIGPRVYLYVMCCVIGLVIFVFILMQLRAGKHGKRRQCKKFDTESTHLNVNNLQDSAQEQRL